MVGSIFGTRDILTVVIISTIIYIEYDINLINIGSSLSTYLVSHQFLWHITAEIHEHKQISAREHTWTRERSQSYLI